MADCIRCFLLQKLNRQWVWSYRSAARYWYAGDILYPILSMFILSMLAGCGEAFNPRSTELESKRIFQQLSQISIAPNSDVSLPAMYVAPARVIPSEEGVKVYYFTKHQPPEILTKLIKEQLGYLVSQNGATNQLVVKCSDKHQAQYVLDFLREVDVPPVQVRVDCLIYEIFADLTIDYETHVDIRGLLDETLGIKSMLPGASIRASGRDEMGFKLSIAREKLDGVIDLLESRGYAKVLMRPTVEIVNGRTARIQIKERIPTPEKLLTGSTIIDTVKYQDIQDFLEVTVQVYADGAIGLRTSAGIASRTPDGVEQIPVLTERQIDNEENRLKKGQSLVIGGILKKERISVVRNIPGIKNIPILGSIFSGRDFEDRVKEILFVLTPTISNNGMENEAILGIIHHKLEGKPPSFCNVNTSD